MTWKKTLLLLHDYFSVVFSVVKQFIINGLYYYIFLVRITYNVFYCIKEV